MPPEAYSDGAFKSKVVKSFPMLSIKIALVIRDVDDRMKSIQRGNCVVDPAPQHKGMSAMQIGIPDHLPKLAHISRLLQLFASRIDKAIC